MAPRDLLAFAVPSETALLDWTRARVSREMIHEIALHDYERDIEVHELAILKQLGPKPELGLLPWHPREVLELERWAEPDEPHNEQPPTGIAGHFKRLFACTILLRNVAYVVNPDFDGEFFIATSAATVRQLVRSCIALDREALRLGIGFLLWLHGEQSNPMLRPFASFGVLLLHIQGNVPGTDLLDTCRWVEEDEALARQQLDQDEIHSAKWLVGLNYQEDGGEKPKLWTNIIARVISAQSKSLPKEVEPALGQMRDRMLE